MNREKLIQAAHTLYEEWNAALSSKDLPRLLSLYADDIVLESPLIPHLLPQETGILRGKEALQAFAEQVFKHQPKKRQFHRDSFFTDGYRMMWEYPRLTPNGDQMDFVEVMEINNGVIQKHRVYWGWVGFGVMKRNEHFNNA